MIRERDWSDHPLGPPETWPDTLKIALGIVLNSPESMLLAYGPDLHFFFNETYFPLLGPRLPHAMGMPFRELWADGWDQARPIVEDALAGKGTRFVDLPWVLSRYGVEELSWWTFSYSPILDASGDVVGMFCLTNETTERVSGEATRRAEESRNRQILDSAIDYAIVATDMEGHVTRWNAGAQALLGWREDEVLGMAIARIFTPEDVAAGRPAVAMRAAIETGAAADERWHVRKTGERFWAAGEMTPLRDTDGTINGFVQVLRDRTGHRLAEERRSMMQTRLSSALELAQLGTFDWDVAAGTVSVDRRSCEIFGLGEVEVVGVEDIFGMIDPADRARVVAASSANATSGLSLEMEYGIVLRDGGWRYVSSNAFARSDSDGVATHMFGAFRDITDRKRYEDDLRRTNEELETSVFERTAERDRLWETSPDLLVLLSFDGRLQRINPAWTTILGYEPEELLGRHVESLVIPEDVATTREALAAAIIGSMLPVENRYRHKDGSICWFSWVAAPTDRVIYAAGRHITAAKESEAALRRAEDQLRQSQKVEAVGQLTGGVAHDFNNLLTVIRGSVDLLRRADVSEERRQRYIAAIADTADRASKLTAQLLAFARRQALMPETFDVCAGIATLHDMIATLTGSRISITVAIPSDGCFVHADRNQFDTAIVNMTANARDAMNGQGDLTIRVAAVEGLPAMRNHPFVAGAYVAVSIIDSGAGIPDDRIDRIFEPFFTTKNVGEGTGLGLSQVYGFAKQSGGEVLADNVQAGGGDGKTDGAAGAIFTLYLPQVAACSTVVDRSDAVAIETLGLDACVLVVEDNPEVGLFATDALTELGYRTMLAIDGIAALAILQRDRDSIDVVFSDVMMPGMTGIELGQRIRALYPDLPVMLASGYSTVLAENGTHGFTLIQKPYSLEALSRAFRGVLSRRVTNNAA